MTARTADQLLQVLDSTLPFLQSLSPETVSQRPAPDRWTIQEVLGHLIDSAANNHQRFVRAQFTTELIFPKYEQNEWVRSQHYGDADWPALVTLWAAYNRHLAHVIRHVDPAALPVRCVIGPYEPVTLGYLIEDYVVHLNHHLAKIRERVSGGGSGVQA